MSAIVVLKRDKLEFYFSDLDAGVSCPVPSSAVSDMEVTSEAELDTTLKLCLSNVPKRGTQQAALVIADDVCFTVQMDPEKEEETKKMLLSSSPFSRVVTVTVKTPNGSVMSATNQDLYETVARIIEIHGFNIVSVAPQASLVLIGMSPEATFDKTAIKHFFDSLGTIKSASFPYTPQAPTFVQPPDKLASAKSAKVSRWLVIFIVAAFVYAVIIVLVFIR